MKWHKRPISAGEHERCVKQFGLDHITAAICLRRGLNNTEELRYFLHHELYLLHNPFLISNIEQAALRILQAHKRQEQVFIFGDRDVDGMTSTALLVDLLRDMDINVSWRVPMNDEPYGITSQVIEHCVAINVNLIITIDCGIHNVHEVSMANDHTIDTIIIDHHNVTGDLPPAYAIVNPKLAESDYPMSEICGCMLGYKLAQVMNVVRSPLYNQTHQLVVARRSTHAIHFDICTVRNLQIIAHHYEVAADHNSRPDLSHSSFMKHVGHHPIYIYGEDNFQKLFSEAYSQTLTLPCHDLQRMIAKVNSSLASRNLYDINSDWLIERSVHSDRTEINILHQLYTYWQLFGAPTITPLHRSFLALAAVATVADMMPMRNENRIMVQAGLRQLAHNPSRRFQNLLRVNPPPAPQLTARYLSFNIIPHLNAAGRRGAPDVAVNLLLSTDEAHSQALSKQLIQFNNERRTIFQQSLNIALPLARQSYTRYGARFVVVAHPDIPRGVTGLLASHIVERLRCTAVIIALAAENSRGSLRTMPIHRATEILAQCAHLLIEWGGHDRAAGFEINPANISAFETALSHSMEQTESPADTNTIEIDAEIPPDHFSENIFNIVQWFEPYGQGNPPITFLTKGVEVQDMVLFGKEDQHVKLILQFATYRVPTIVWNGSEHINHTLQRQSKIDLIYRVETNYYQQQAERRLIAIDIQQHAP